MFEHNPAGPDWPGAVMFLDVALVPLFAFWAIGCEQYLLSALFGLLFAALADPGGGYGRRALDIAVFALIGSGVTALAFGIGTDDWGGLALAAFGVTLAGGLAAVSGTRRCVNAWLLGAWFVVAIGLESGLHASDLITSRTWAQVLAWTGGAALWLVAAFARWLIRGRTERPRPLAELPGDTSWKKPDLPLIRFAVIRALAVAGTVALAYGPDLSHGGWIPIAAVIAMKPSPEQTAIVSAQRLTGALIGAAVATLLLLAPPSEHGIRLFAVERGLEAVALVLFAHGAAIRFRNPAYCTAAVTAGALVLVELPQHSGGAAEGYRVLWTLCGVGIGLLAMWLADRVAERAAGAHGNRPAAAGPPPDLHARVPEETAHRLPGDRRPGDRPATADHGR
ncbi:FUSC family protein [Streptomyces sp. NPDC021080]|uniref:FUSC family protein n=1 Tax=Streptomyces sp. NPDC021080 TaxID=3365110 RepID=UPI00379F6377